MKTITINNRNTRRITPFSDEELYYFRGLILAKRDEAEETRQTLKRALDDNREGNSDDSAYSAHLADVGTEEQDRATLYMLYQRTQKFIRQLNAALERIENGTYGVCKITGKPIPKERLEIVPHTQHSVEAKMRLQRAS